MRDNLISFFEGICLLNVVIVIIRASANRNFETALTLGYSLEEQHHLYSRVHKFRRRDKDLRLVYELARVPEISSG